MAATVKAIAEERGEQFPIILGDHYGEVVTSTEFSALATRVPYVCCVIGGLGGLHDALPDWQIDRVSFGRIILSPSLARVVMLDQLYRAMQESRGVAYDLN